MSSSGYPQIEFGYDDGEDTEDDDADDESDDGGNAGNLGVDNKRNTLALRRSRSDSRYQRSFKTILYISMEYCEKRTLRDLIRKGLYKESEEIWRYVPVVLQF